MKEFFKGIYKAWNLTWTIRLLVGPLLGPVNTKSGQHGNKCLLQRRGKEARTEALLKALPCKYLQGNLTKPSLCVFLTNPILRHGTLKMAYAIPVNSILSFLIKVTENSLGWKHLQFRILEVPYLTVNQIWATNKKYISNVQGKKPQ